MKIIKSTNFLKILVFVALSLTVAGFFYFEASLLLRILVVILSLFGLWQISKTPEILAMILLYLGLYDFYNIRYGLAIPMAVILVAVFLLVVFLYYFLARIYRFEELIDKNVSLIYLLTLGLVVLEIFLAMSLWPVDPKTKTLVIVIAFYLASKLIYLNVNRVLNLKRSVGFVIASVLILAGVISFTWWQGF